MKNDKYELELGCQLKQVVHRIIHTFMIYQPHSAA